MLLLSLWPPPLQGQLSDNVKETTANGAVYVMLAQNVAGPSYTITGLTNGTVYYFVVSGTNSGGESPDSLQVAVQPVSLAPAQLGSVFSGGQLQLSWPADHLGWYLQVQTNRNGIGSNWYDWPETAGTNLFSIPLDTSNPALFLRLTSP